MQSETGLWGKTTVLYRGKQGAGAGAGAGAGWSWLELAGAGWSRSEWSGDVGMEYLRLVW
jgi:hypothetical protein